jgi:hypothetical protein
LLDVHVHVLERGVPLESAGRDLALQLVEPRLDRVALGRRNQPDMGQHGGMRPASLNIEHGQSPVERHGFAELQHKRGGLRRETPAPGGLRILGHRRDPSSCGP